MFQFKSLGQKNKIAGGAREYWLNAMLKIAHPVLWNAANDQLKEKMPVYGRNTDRMGRCTYLEALGRSICGIGPWLEHPLSKPAEEEKRQQYAELARQAIARATDPQSRDYMLFVPENGIRQPLVDTAFLVEGILRSKNELWDKQENRVKDQIITCVEMTREICPWRNNWILFSAMVEVFLKETSHTFSPAVIDYALSQFEQWYVGDGCHKDGNLYRFDYYNGIVIHPLLLDIGRHFSNAKVETLLQRSQRYGEILEKLIGSDGTYPVVGRSVSYRMGIFHSLAQLAYMKELGNHLTEPQVRCAMTAVLQRIMSSEPIDKEGWLKIGVYGSQPGLGENYISTGSLYMCMAFFMPLGLAEDDSFWRLPNEDWTALRVWRGEDMEADHAL